MSDPTIDRAKAAAAAAAADAERLQAEAQAALARAQEAAAAATAAVEAAKAQAAAAAQPAPAASPSAAPPASAGPLSAAEVDAIRRGYAFEGVALELGALLNGTPVPDAQVRIPLGMLNRHGLIAGATGTGKTRTLQALTEQLSSHGVPVFAADIKGDLSGVATPGSANPKLTARTSAIGQDWSPASFPVEYFSLGGNGTGVPIRATVSGFGPLLLAKVLGLNETQESSLALVFHYADDHGLALAELEDLRAVLQYLTGDEGKAELAGLGGISPATVGVILRELVAFADAGAEGFFGEPEIDTKEFLRTAPDGRGIVSLLEVPGVADRPALYSTFLMWLLADLFNDLPEVGDADKPKLVFFFDEAHLLFADASKDFLDQVVRTVRLIRSKGVGIVFVTQTPKDVPGDVLGQLGSRVQHQLRAFTPDDAKALRATVQTYPRSAYELEEVLTTLGIGEAVVTVMNENGAPTPVAWTRLRAPQGSMAPSAPGAMQAVVAASPLEARYGTALDRETAFEILTARMNAAAAAEQASKDQAEEAKAKAAADKAAAAEARRQATEAAAEARKDAADRREAQRDQAAAERAAKAKASAQRKTVDQVTRVLTSRSTQKILGGVLQGIFGTRRR
ncbi:helicase HerA-like domain-containing protein [uncultured Amnibacterium sp.]|uniref:helicase HerA-like domain-containing protein n=1 Tax=uncultured Amnibacterium sp. TaxID=1631851 RepID=UPI0035CC4E22